MEQHAHTIACQLKRHEALVDWMSKLDDVELAYVIDFTCRTEEAAGELSDYLAEVRMIAEVEIFERVS